MKFDQYEVLCREDGSLYRLGQGATSSSYKALDLTLKSPVVLKVIRPEFLEDEEARKRFLREARAAALLRHPNVAMIYRLGEEDGACFYAREYVEGETLEAKVKRDGPFPVEDALKIALQVAQALIAVKKMDLVHRDIKPSNLMRTPDGTIKIIDFGLTKSTPHGGGQLELITMAGFVGTPDYASPEQLNEDPVDVASDMYSLGATLWFLLAGRPPFRGPMAQVMAKHLHDSPPFEELSEQPRTVINLLAHLLEKEAARRPASPSVLVEEIEACLASVKEGPAPLAQAGATKSLSPGPEARKMSAAREPVSATPERQFFLGEVLIGAAIAFIIYFVLTRPAEPPPVGPSHPAASAPAGTGPSALARKENAP